MSVEPPFSTKTTHECGATFLLQRQGFALLERYVAVCYCECRRALYMKLV